MHNIRMASQFQFSLSLLALVLCALAQPIRAMQALSENELGAVNGRDGVTFGVQSEVGITADQIKWTTEEGDVLENSLLLGKSGNAGDGIVVSGIGLDGAATSNPLDITVAVDAHTNGAGRAGLGIDARWQRMRTRIESISVSDETRSFGTAVIDSAGRFALFGDGGLLNASTDGAELMINVGNVDSSDSNPTNWTIADPGQLYFRMNGPGSTEALLDNLGFLFHMHKGTVGIDAEGLIVKSAPEAITDLNLTFDIFANVSSTLATEFTKHVDSLPLLFFGWRGGLEDFELTLKPKGAWLADNTPTQGLTASLGFNLADNFQFVVGEAGGDHSYLEFTDPQSLPRTLNPSRKDVEFGSLTVDTVLANQGVGPICYGGSNSASALGACNAESFSSLQAQEIELAPSESGLALISRNWGLHAYSSKVSYRDGTNSALDFDNEGWALIYTLGDINSNIYLYPQTGSGIKSDVVLAIQTLGNTDVERWENGTHLMIGDTDADLAIGLVGADLLFAAKELDIGLSLSDAGLSFHTTQGARIQLRGMFGGGDIPNMSSPVSAMYVDMNLEMDEFKFSILPDLSGDKLNFGGFFSFANLDNEFDKGIDDNHGHDDGTYISFAEPNFDKLGVDFRLAGITGDIEIPASVVGGGGAIDLLPASTEANLKPKLQIVNNFKVGTLARSPTTPGTPGDPFMINRIEFGGQKLGSMIIPAAQIYTSITLEQQ